MIDDKRIDLRPYGIARKVDVRVIRTIRCEHSQNRELSFVVVCLKNGEKLTGPVIVGNDAVHVAEEIRSIYQQKMDGRKK